MAKYYYHPLGNYAAHYVNEDVPASAYPHSYPSHGYSKLDWGCGADQPVYSMTDGFVSSICCRNSSEQAGFVVVIKTDRKDSTGNIFINYLELGGLSEKMASIAGIESGPGVFGEIGNSGFSDFTLSGKSTAVAQGELIGYTNRHYATSCLHLDFTYGDGYGGTLGHTDRKTCFNTPTGTPHIEDFSMMNEAFSIENNIVSTNGKLLWKNGIYVPDSSGSNLSYKTLDSLSYLVCLQQPLYVAPNRVNGTISLSGEVAFRENMNENAVNAYLNGTMSENWIGPYPNSIAEINNNAGLRRAIVLCTRELNFTEKGNLPAVAYAKLLRAKMIGENRSGDNMAQWFEYLPSAQFAGKDVWISKQLPTSFDLSYAQAVYNNLRYPDLYGTWYGSTDDEFYKCIVHACQQIPIYNVTSGSSRTHLYYLPWAFGVCYNPSTNVNYTAWATGEPIYHLQGNYIAGYGDYIMFRRVNGDMQYFNSKVME